MEENKIIGFVTMDTYKQTVEKYGKKGAEKMIDDAVKELLKKRDEEKKTEKKQT